MNTRRAAARRAEEEMDNVGDQDNPVPPLEEVVMGDQVLVVPPPMTDGEIRADFLSLTQDMTSQSNSITYQVQVMKAQTNRRLDLECLNMLTLWPRI